MRELVVAVAALLALTGICEAQSKLPEPEPPTAAQQADAVLAVLQAKDAAKLKDLAAMDRPDPWRVADELLSRNKADAADAFAKAAPRPDVATLPAYVASRRGKPDDAVARKAVVAAQAALDAKKPADALSVIEAVHPKGGDVVAVQFELVRGDALRDAGRVAESMEVYRKAGEAAESMGWLVRGTLGAHEWGLSAMMNSDFPTALAAWQHRIDLETRRGRQPGTADALSNVGAIHLQVGEYKKALEVLLKALALRDEIGYRERMAPTLLNIAAAYQQLGEHVKALDFAQRGLECSEEAGVRSDAESALSILAQAQRSLGNEAKAAELERRAAKIGEEIGDRAGMASALSDKGGAAMRRGEYATAIDYYTRSLAISEELKDRTNASNRLCDIGGAYIQLAQYARALDFLERARSVKEAIADRRGLANVLLNLGVVHESVGDVERALDCQQRSLAINEAIGNRDGVLANLNGLGNVYSHRKEYKKALEFHQRSLRMGEESHDDRCVARSLANIASIQIDLGDVTSAASSAQRALELAEAHGDPFEAAGALNILGNAYLALHDYPKAVKAFEQCLARSTEIGDQERVVGSQWNLAVALADAGDLRASIESAKRAVAGMRLLTTGADEALSRSMRENFDNVFVVGASAAEHVGDVAAAAYFVESGRAGTLLDSLRGREALRAAAMPQELLDAETAARAVETAAVAELRRALESRKVADIAARRADVDAARTALADVIARIQREAKAAAGVLYAESDPLEVLQRRLRDGEVLVLYTTDAFQQVLALVIGRDSARIAKIAAAKDVETACAALNADDPAADTASAVAALRRLVVDPLALDAKTTQLLISPDGALSYVPFALLCAECEVAYVPSGTTYGLLLDERGKKGEGVLALGDPDYGAKPAAPATPDAVAMRGGMKLVRLPATGVEAKAVGDVVLVGKDASEQGLRDAVAKRPRWHAVHLACHGLIDPERPMFSSLALTPAGEDDGFLTALEVFQMKTPADLVVLSACETGKGKVMKAEGIVGLTRAFMFAGAPRVIVSLWKVDDQATAALMAKFYEGFKKGVPAARALRDAQAYVRAQEKWKHPFYWAAWALWGLPD